MPGADGVLVAATVRPVSALLPFTGAFATGTGGHCLQSATQTQLALPLSAILPKGQWITSNRYWTTAHATILLGDQTVPIPRGAGTILLPASTTGPTSEIVLRVRPRTSLCLQLTVEEAVPSASTGG